MSDLNDLNRPVTTDTEPNVLDTLRAHIIRAATWSGWSGTANKVAGLMSGVTAAVAGGRSLRLYRRNDANTADEEVVSLPGVSIGGSAAFSGASEMANSVASPDVDRGLFGVLPNTYPQQVRFHFAATSATGTGGLYAGVMTYSPYVGTTSATGGPSYQVAYGSTEHDAAGVPQMRLRKGIDATWNSWIDVVTSANVGSFAPSRTGSGASGTWSINITGTAASAATAGSATSAGTAAEVTTTIGSGAIATTQSASDRSDKVATTQWVQNAMGSIASTAGFAALFAATGYVKFPSWLGGLVVQWGSSASVNGVLSFPLTFPTACYSVAVSGGNGGSYIASAGAFTTTGFDAYGFFPNVGRGAASVSYIAIGN